MNVLIVGLGSIARKHITALRAICPEINVTALRHSSKSTPEEGITDLYSVEEISSCGQQFDFAIISNPSSEHAAAIRALLPHKLPLFIEKPLTHTPQGLELLINDIQESGVPTYVACNLRFLDCITQLKSILSQKSVRINEVNIYCGSYLPDWRPGTNYKEVYSARPELGGGVHMDLIHELDYTYYLFGKPEKVHEVRKSHSSLNIKATDYAAYCLEYENFCTSVILNYYRRDPKRQIEIVCEHGTLLIDLLSNSIYENSKLIYHSDNTILNTYEKQLRYFINCLHNKLPMFNDVQEASTILKTFIF